MQVHHLRQQERGQEGQEGGWREEGRQERSYKLVMNMFNCLLCRDLKLKINFIICKCYCYSETERKQDVFINQVMTKCLVPGTGSRGHSHMVDVSGH